MFRYRTSLKDSIATKLLQVVFGVYFIITLIVTMVQISLEYFHQEDKIQHEIQSLPETFEPVLANALWTLNHSQIQSTLYGMLKIPVVAGIWIEDDRGQVIHAIGRVMDRQGKSVSYSEQGELLLQEDQQQILSKLTGFDFPINYQDNDGSRHLVGKWVIFSSRETVIDRVQHGFILILINSVIKTLALWLIFLLFVRMILGRPLSTLTSTVEQIDLDNLGDTYVDLQTSKRNELKILADAFNTMIQKLHEDTEQIKEMTRSFEKFVPKQFLNRIATESLEKIELGQADNEIITILFADIRSFTAFSESITPQELLNFLNAYLSHMSKPIYTHHGFIDKFIGDAIMALFDLPEGKDADEAEAAIQAAIAMQQTLQIYNQGRSRAGYLPITTGIGIHTGPVVIGTVGSEDRMDSTVLGDTVNVAARLEGLTKYYGANIIISNQTLEYLENPEHYCYRELDWLRVKGKKEPLQIYEVFNADSPEIQSLKEQSGKYIKEGLYLRQTQQWEQARSTFQKSLTIYADDKAALLHLERCQELEKMQLPDKWDGAIQLDLK